MVPGTGIYVSDALWLGFLGAGTRWHPAPESIFHVPAYLSRKTGKTKVCCPTYEMGGRFLHVVDEGAEMSVIKRGNSKYWYIQFQLNGKTYIRSSRTVEKRLAEQMEREWKRQLHANQFLGQKERISFGDAIDGFIKTKQGIANHKNLLIQRCVIFRLYSVHRYIDEITSQEMERLKRDRFSEGVGDATVKHMFNLVRGAWKYARRMGYQVSEFQIPNIKTPKHRLRYLSFDEEKLLLKELNPLREGNGLRPYKERADQIKRAMQDAYDLVIILLDTGARYGEIANIEWSNINLPDRSIRLWRPKVRNESILFLTDRAYRILSLRHQNKASQYVFMNKKGGPRGYAAQAIRKAMKRAGLSDCTIHTLRHTHATRLIQNGMNIYEVKEVLGHSDIKTTMRYAHLEQRDVSSRARDVIERINHANNNQLLTVVKR